MRSKHVSRDHTTWKRGPPLVTLGPFLNLQPAFTALPFVSCGRSCLRVFWSGGLARGVVEAVVGVFQAHVMSMLLPVADSRSESTPCARVSIVTSAWQCHLASRTRT